MRSFIFLLTICTSIFAFAETNEADRILALTVRMDSKRYSLHCVRKERNPDLQMGEHGIRSDNEAWQNIWYQNQRYSVVATKRDDKIEVKISSGSNLLSHYVVPFEFNFDTTMDLFHFRELGKPELEFLGKVACRYTPRIYDFTHSSTGPLVIGVHTEGLYFADSAIAWFNDLFDQHARGNRLVTRDTALLLPGQNYTDESFLEFHANNEAHVVVSHKDPTHYKLSPGGWMLVRFTSESSDQVVLSGGFLNMCMSNTLVQLANAFLSSEKPELVVNISRLNSYAQAGGMTNALTLPLGPGAFPLWMLQEQQPEIAVQLFEGIRQYLQIMSKHKIEVVLEDEVPQTDLPTFRIKTLDQ